MVFESSVLFKGLRYKTGMPWKPNASEQLCDGSVFLEERRRETTENILKCDQQLHTERIRFQNDTLEATMKSLVSSTICRI